MKEKFETKRFSAESQNIIKIANMVLVEYAKQNYTLTLRQLYYQLVARDYIENSVKSYKRIGDIVSDGRLAGLIDWAMIEDRGRDAYLPLSWKSPAEIVMTAAKSFRIDRWIGQENYVEVMVEKDALSGIISPVCSRLHVRFTANKGYSSNSAMYEAGKRVRAALLEHEGTANKAHIIYLGDHDPSGIDMTRDITKRITMFADLDDDDFYEPIQVHRIALNYDQVEAWQPPKNPAKVTDSRYESYAEKFGTSSWELDAVNPSTLSELVRETITSLLDVDLYKKTLEREEEMRAELREFADNYEDDK